MSLSISIDRASLTLSALVIGTDPTAGMWLANDGIGRPAKSRRNTYAASSPFVHGQTLTQSVLEHSSLPLSVYAQGSTGAALKTLMDNLEDAVGQFAYTVAVTEDGVTRTWDCDPGDISWGEVDAGMSAAHMARATITIPCYPVAS